MDIDLRFDRGHFHHLAGFQYLRDIDFIRTAEREAVFLAVLEERITMALLEKSELLMRFGLKSQFIF